MKNILVFDVETTISNNGNPFDVNNFLVSYAYATTDSIHFKYYTDPDFRSCIRDAINSCDVIVGFNIKFDLHWLRNIEIVIPSHVKVWDCQIAEFILSGQESAFPSLNDTCEKYGLDKKPDRIKEYWEAGISTENISIEELEEYNKHDVMMTRIIYETQNVLLRNPTKELILLEGEDLKTLQSAEYAGIKFNNDEAINLIQEQDEKLFSIGDFLSDYLPSGIPVGCYNWNSGDHLSALLYGGTIVFKYSTAETTTYKSGPNKGQEYTRNRWSEVPIVFPARFKPVNNTELKKTREDEKATTRFYQTDEPTLKQITTRKKENKELLEALKSFSVETKIKEMAQSLIDKIKEMNWKDNYLHGQFNQVVARTGRLSSSAPNLQNQPDEIKKLLVSRYE